jgi:hypothetical protein
MYPGALIVTFLLSIFLIYISAFLGMTFFNAQLEEEGLICDTLGNCLLYFMTFGLRNGGGIGDSMPTLKSSYDSSDISYSAKVIYDLLFFIVINVLMLNLIFGIIIDSFAELRNEGFVREQNRNNICFVCGAEKSDFDKKRRDFRHHVNTQHTPWKYIFFINYLKNMNSEDLSTIETDIFKNYKDNTDWIPYGDTLSLGEVLEKKDELAEIMSGIEALKDMVDTKDGTALQLINTKLDSSNNQIMIYLKELDRKLEDLAAMR